MRFFLCIVLVCVLNMSAVAFRITNAIARRPSTQLKDMSAVNSLFTAVTEKSSDYVYGAVAAPDFVLPLGAVLVVATAAIPFLLRPGEQALEQQRKDEEAKGTGFNKRKNKDLR